MSCPDLESSQKMIQDDMYIFFFFPFGSSLHQIWLGHVQIQNLLEKRFKMMYKSFFVLFWSSLHQIWLDHVLIQKLLKKQFMAVFIKNDICNKRNQAWSPPCWTWQIKIFFFFWECHYL